MSSYNSASFYDDREEHSIEARLTVTHKGDLWRDGAIQDLASDPPLWVDDMLGPHPARLDVGLHVSAVASGSLTMLTTTIPAASRMLAPTLRTEVALAYGRIERAMAAINREPLRFWNYIPSIGEAMGNGLDRYMVFNAGRYDALAPDFQPDRPIARPPATASAIGVGGTDLSIHCLASDAAGAAVENPRQTSSWRYSSCYGPKPPCFSRATITTLGGRLSLLIGGTASIVGEQSLHVGDVEEQLEETLRNIAVLIGAARRRPDETLPSLDRLREVRVYAVTEDVGHLVRERLAVRCPEAHRVEVVRARVCRPELLLEIEGIADL